jgi:hypothetical protein
LRFFYDPKNKQVAVRALMEKAKADRDDAEKTYNLFYETKNRSRETAPWISRARASSPSAGRSSVCKNRRRPVESPFDMSYLAEARK